MPVFSNGNEGLVIEGAVTIGNRERNYRVRFAADNAVVEAVCSDEAIKPWFAEKSGGCPRGCNDALKPEPLTPTPGKPTSPSRLLPPGTWLAMLIQVVTFGLVRPCAACKGRMRAMDQRGLARLLKRSGP